MQKAQRKCEAKARSRGAAFKKLKKIAAKGVIQFCIEALGFKPTGYQQKFLEDTAQFIAQRWCRQSGKDHSASGRLFWFAVDHDGVQLAVVGPSFRQSKLVIRKINSFVQKLPADIPYPEILVGGKLLKTKVALVNDSVVEAYPCNPDTIRGPTLHGILVTEFNFVKDDEELYDAILFTLGTTSGFFIANSTPWSRDHIFYRICKEREFSDFSRDQVVTWKEAQEPDGPLKKTILAKIRRQLEADPWRWQREMEAEWAEDESCWLSTSLITACTDPNLEIKEVDRQHSFWAESFGRELPS
jgi:hypothetical protein